MTELSLAEHQVSNSYYVQEVLVTLVSDNIINKFVS